MKLTTLCCAAVLVGATALITNQVASQDTQPPPESAPQRPAKPNAEQDTDSLVDTWIQHAMPGEHHQLLARMTGSWSMAIEYRMNADSPVVTSQGTCQRKWILGDRFVLEEFDGGSLALPFQGMAIYGYDSFEQKYTSIWVDTTNTAITTSLGTCQDTCDLIRFQGRHGDPWTGVKRPSRGATRFVTADQHVLELYEPGADGKEFKILQITYTRT
ncbi:MAG TPA: DUF1579 family protein [Phycisphaerae bacterium]|nr:DUF1579 family protein [Phycisphaerae bacterium]